MSNKKRIGLFDYEAEYLGFDVKQNEVTKTHKRNQARYCLTEDQIDTITVYRLNNSAKGFVETIRKKDKKGNTISTTEKLQSDIIEVPEGFKIVKISTSKTTGQQWVQSVPKKAIDEIKEIDFDSIIKKHCKRIDVNVSPKKQEFSFDRLVYTDVHIGMETNQNGHAMYATKWDEDNINKTLDSLIQEVISTQKSNTLIIDELGDFMDGWDGETTRKGHKLPQNMDNEKAFDVGLGFKVRMIDALIPYYESIVCHNICNDNHAGSFGYVVNSSFKKIIEIKYKNVEVINYRSFINHYQQGKNCFILTHGKDGTHLKFGFKPILDTKQEKKISNYIDEHFLMSKGVKIEFSKGDSHQDILDSSTSDKFDYYNYPALSPSSEWVQTNFQRGKRGFYIFNYRKDGSKVINPTYF